MTSSFKPDFHNRSILIIDDTPANVGILVDYLEDLGFEVIVAQNGKEGMRRAQFARPDLILLDVMMPGIDGIETCRRLKAEKSTADIPVIFMTALSDTKDKVAGFDAGGVDYIVKPFQIQEVFVRIKLHLSLRSAQQLVESQNIQLQKEAEIRRQAEDALLITQFSVDHAADAIFWLAPDGRISYANNAACRLLQYDRDALLAMHAFHLEIGLTRESWPDYWAHVKARSSTIAETAMRAKDGSEVPIEVTLNDLNVDGKEYIFCFARDIRERKRAEQALLDSYAKLQESNLKQDNLYRQLLQSEKMASIGQLAAGVAHEINNPIAFVNSNLGALQDYARQLLEMLEAYERLEAVAVNHPHELQLVQQTREKLDLNYLREDLNNLLTESLDGVQRVQTIVQNLKDFSHAGEPERQLTDLHPGIERTLNIVWNEIKHKAQVIKEYGDIPLIEAVPAQLNQVFMNLLVNAAHAIERNGTVTIRTAHEGPWVWVEIADTGSGIAPENLTRIFEPFFTTKPVGKGTGLGLSLSYAIITQHGGRIDVQSEVGRGSAFRVWLPLTLPEREAAEH